MQLACTHCGQVLDISGKRPSFCAYCGKSLSDASDKAGSTVDFDHEAATRAPDPADTLDDADPTEIGGYRLLRVLGVGGMGKVYEAEDAATGRRVALKLIAAQYAGSAETVERFRREGRLASALVHPRCVFVLAADEEAGRPYIVMELMPGETLEDLIRKQGPLAPEQALPKILDVIEGLNEAHRLGVVHRDVKPSNCFLEPDGRVKVGDFGLAKSLMQGGHLTKTGSFLGTPLFASPEQIKGEPTGPQADVYSVAATLYCLLTGQAPFQCDDPAATLARIVCDPPPPMRSLRPELPEALDKVVLRGLERDRERRWQDLDELEAALRPLLPGTLSFAGLSVRFGAYLIDHVLLNLLANAITVPVISFRGDLTAFTQPRLEFQAGYQLLGALIFLVYFAVPEAFWGWSPGKRLLGLRVVRASGTEPPGLWRSLLRTGVFWGLTNLSTFAILLLLFFGAVGSQTRDPFVQLREAMLMLGTLPLLLVGIVLVVCTMRTRNGYRGLHEWASGTRVIRVPEAEARRNLGRRCAALRVSSAEGLPQRLGAFDVLGALRTGGRDALLLGEDHALGRKVVLWLRPAAGGTPLSLARRQLSRVTRPRWLSGGRHADQLWDAFLLPAGHPLPAVVDSDGRLSWADTRHLLTQLTQELAASTADRTMPAVLTLDQVWVQGNGRLQLLDLPLGEEVPGDALDLLGDVAVLALEGRPRRPDAEPSAIRTPLPQHAARLLNRLTGASKPYSDLEQWQRDLANTADRSTAVTRGRRLAHLAVQAAFLSVGLCAGWMTPVLGPGMVPVWLILEVKKGEQTRADLHAVAVQEVVAALQADVFTRTVLLQQLGEDLHLDVELAHSLGQQRIERDARLQGLSWIGRAFVQMMEKSLADAQAQLAAKRQTTRSSSTAEVRDLARKATRQENLSSDMGQDIATFETWMLLAWPAVWVVWAFVCRGGLAFRLFGLSLVRWNGRPAWQLQCAWRALLIWAPLAALAVVSVWLEARYWSEWRPDVTPSWILLWLSSLAWWMALALFLINAALTLWRPERSLYDRLSGTYLVPR